MGYKMSLLRSEERVSLDVGRVASYIANQEEHHRKRTYAEEYEMFVTKYGLEWPSEGNH